jgi:hypothetical protein
MQPFFNQLLMKKKKIIISVIALILIVLIVVKIKQSNSSLGKATKISQKKCKEAFEILTQIKSALLDKSKLSIAESSWLLAINKL